MFFFICAQRIFKKKSKLAKEKIQLLDAIGFVWDVSDSQWEVSFNELLVYKAAHGNVNVPQGTSLGSWVNTQRHAERKGALPQVRIKRLDEIGFVWNPFESQWEEKFSELLAYESNHGNMNVPRGESDLCAWIDRQRAAKKSGEISPERIRRLEEVGFEWVRQKK